MKLASIAQIQNLQTLKEICILHELAHSAICTAQTASKAAGLPQSVDLAKLTWDELQLARMKFKTEFKNAQLGLDEAGCEYLHTAIWGH